MMQKQQTETLIRHYDNSDTAREYVFWEYEK